MQEAVGEVNKTQIDTVERLRREGKGLSVIAQETGISINTIKSHLSRHGISAPRLIRTCMFCNAEIKTTDHFCSDACRAAWWNAHREHPNGKGQTRFICQHCKKPFVGYPAQNPKYCCHACYIAARYGKEREDRG